jgi:hypothetical protein
MVPCTGDWVGPKAGLDVQAKRKTYSSFGGTNAIREHPARISSGLCRHVLFNLWIDNETARYLVHKSPLRDHVQSQMSSVFALLTSFFNVYFKIILPSTRMSSNTSYPLGFGPEFCTNFCCLRCALRVPPNSSLLICHDWQLNFNVSNMWLRWRV